jgi:16S rRNA (adenine1518-N6/adenine1519-N6)-dimethyltransferase
MSERPRKEFGQHFLHDPAVIARIMSAIAPSATDCMVEIGGGRGALTRPLLAVLEHLEIIELDRALIADLAALGNHPTHCAVHQGDALKFDFGSLARTPQSLRIVGNLPYNISTPLLFHLLEQHAAIKDMHFMLQREVVRRMIARPGNKEYGRLTVMLAAWTEIERLFDVGPGAFTPAPRVWSTFVRIRPRREARFPIADQRQFATVVAHVFSMRRKTLARSLRGLLGREEIAAAGIDPGARPETLEPAVLARLAALCAPPTADPEAASGQR